MIESSLIRIFKDLHEASKKSKTDQAETSFRTFCVQRNYNLFAIERKYGFPFKTPGSILYYILSTYTIHLFF